MKLLTLFLLLFAVCGCTSYNVVPIQNQTPPPSGGTPIIGGNESVLPTISLVTLPASVQEGQTFTVQWNVDSTMPLTATHTAVHYDVVSHPGTFGLDITPAKSGYPSFTQKYASGEFALPGMFSADIVVPSGSILYLRAHVIVNGNNVWTDEKTIMITSNPSSTIQ